MDGRNHVIAASSSLLTVGSLALLAEKHIDYVPKLISKTKFFNAHETLVTQLIHKFTDWAVPKWSIPVVFIILICLFLYYFGTLLPDVDLETSTLGRFIYVPFEHRTWTHAVWFPLLVFIASHWVPVLAWLGLGYIVHLFWDSWSVCGVCWLYPITKYRSCGPNRKVKKKHIIKLYGSGHGELGFVIIISVLTILLFGYAVFDQAINIPIVSPTIVKVINHFKK